MKVRVAMPRVTEAAVGIGGDLRGENGLGPLGANYTEKRFSVPV